MVMTLVATRNLHRAAEQLNLSQPGATKLLRETELTLGSPLFVRTSRGMEPTIYGEAVGRYARVFLNDLARLGEELRSLREGVIGTVRIGAITEAIPGLVDEAIRQAKTIHPDVSVSLIVSTSNKLLAALEEGEIEIAVGRMTVARHQDVMLFEPLREEYLSIIARPDHPLRHRSDLDLKDLQDFDWILLPPSTPIRRSIDIAFSQKNLALPRHTIETASMLTTTSLVGRSDMLAVMPETVAQYYEDAGLVSILPVQLPSFIGVFGIIRLRDRPMTAAANAFIDLIRHIGASGGGSDTVA
ncbi:LysR family transcriptional regulator [Sinorhizobium arboris]|uniref:LysR family transcriptional regulator n=1 Tax=Sinorhizobium arboris TaxID=76745 RepID=UPI003B00EA6A